MTRTPTRRSGRGPADCRLIGRWRITEADLWGRGWLDLDGPATLAIGADGRGELTAGALRAGLELEYAPTLVFFTWAGFDDMTDVRGSGSAELLEDGRVEIEFAYEDGDEAVMRGERM